jgi:DNA-binding HxlR family transcriptional regulator
MSMGYHMLHENLAVKKAPGRHLVSSRKPADEKPVANPYDSKCPTRIVLDRIADKWTVLVLGLLSENPLRFNQLRRAIDGLTQKMLSQTLKALERDGLVSRKVTPSVPIAVEYSITPLGRTLAATIDGLRIWAQTHIRDVVAAQTRYDSDQGIGDATLPR